MNVIFLVSLQLLVIRDTLGQFINHVQSGYMPYHPQRQYDEYDYRRWGRQSRFHKRSGGRFPEYSAESNYDYGRSNCKCSCRYCENIKPCCLPICNNCNSQSLVFVPYPVPLVVTVTSNTTPNSTTTATTTVTTSTTKPTTESTTSQQFEETITSSTPTFGRNKNLPEGYDYGSSTFPAFYNKKKLLLTKKNCLRGQCPNYRRMDLIDALLRNERKDNYEDFVANPRKNQRFGIIPIPDKMALEFMTNMRDMKLNELLQSKLH